MKGSFEGLKGYTMGRMTKSHRGKLYINDARWGPDAGSIEYGYRVPFGGIHVFIGKINESKPKPDTYTNTVEMAQHAQPARVQAAAKHAFVGFIHGATLEEGSVSKGETVISSDGESSTSETDSMYLLENGGLGAVPMVTVFWILTSR